MISYCHDLFFHRTKLIRVGINLLWPVWAITSKLSLAPSATRHLYAGNYDYDCQHLRCVVNQFGTNFTFMKSLALVLAAVWMMHGMCLGQLKKEDIFSEFVLSQHRVVMENDIRNRIIGKTFASVLDSNTEFKYESACQAITQFALSGPQVELGFATLFSQYDSLAFETKRSFLEAVYATYPVTYGGPVLAILQRESNPKLVSMCALYLYRMDPSGDKPNRLKAIVKQSFPRYDTVNILTELVQYLDNHSLLVRHSCPDIVQLFRYQKRTGAKTIYSFQRWDRDYAGMAIVQNADGSFVTDAFGKLRVFEQLARSGSNLPYFITNGSTPQGIYSIQGIDVAHNQFIGPTPNIQMLLPFESNWARYFQQPYNPGEDSLSRYLDLLPLSWRTYTPMMEAWNAGRIGRTEIIAHGTTLDPDFFKSQPYYPCTPTQGCLCAKEIWNTTTGRLVWSDEFGLVEAFRSSPGNKGYLIVINVDDQKRPVSSQEIELWVKAIVPAK
jgi:hypothetical protein